VWLSDFFKGKELPPKARAEETIRAFVSSVKALQHKPTFVVELDLQKLYGHDTVDAWRQDIWVPFESETGIRVCYVWHPVDGQERWKALLDSPDHCFLGMAGLRSLSHEARVGNALQAYVAGKPTHGFAAVDVRWLKSTPFFSVDSTSWAVSAQAFGNAVRFDATTGGFKRYKIGNAQVRKDARVAELGILETGIHASDVIDRGRERNKKEYARYYTQSAKPYAELEEWHTARWRLKGIDWDKRLSESGFVVANAQGGHLQAPAL
jgi:hypothetical protein